jgi:DnaJ-domain-containing protein 1
LSTRTAIDRLGVELRRLGAREDILSTNLLLGQSGSRSDQREPQDPGAAVYFTLYGQPRVLASDHWTRLADNIAAIAAHIGAMRAVDRYAVGTLDQAFAGYAALPASAPEEWWVVLQLPPTATLDEAEAAFRKLARNSHPDVGGSNEDMARLTAARAEAREALARLGGGAR